MKINKNLLSKLSKINTSDMKVNILKKNIKRIIKKIVFIKLVKIKPITNTLNTKNFIRLRTDKIKSNKKLTTYIGSAPNKDNYFIIIPKMF